MSIVAGRLTNDNQNTSLVLSDAEVNGARFPKSRSCRFDSFREESQPENATMAQKSALVCITPMGRVLLRLVGGRDEAALIPYSLNEADLSKLANAVIDAADQIAAFREDRHAARRVNTVCLAGLPQDMRGPCSAPLSG